MVDTNDNLNNDEDNHGQEQQEVEQQQPVADAMIADSNSDSDSNSNSDDGDDDDDDDDEDEEGDSNDESAASVIAADTMIVRADRRAKLLSFLDQYNVSPSRNRNNIDDLVAEALEKAEDDAHAMLCDQNLENYRGLDSDRDTTKEVETIVRVFPNLLSKRKETKWDGNVDEDGVARGWINADDGEGEYPIQCLLDLYGPEGVIRNLKALPFLSDLARLGTELNQFEEEERGGLLINDRYGWNILQYLATMYDAKKEEELNQRLETICLSQLIQLRQMDLFIQADIQRYELVHHTLCSHDHLAERRFQFLVEWDPLSLVHTDEDGWLPLHFAALSSIQAFRIVFEYVIRYCPNKKGITIFFTKNNKGETPFQLTCQYYERDVKNPNLDLFFKPNTTLGIKIKKLKMK